MTKRQFIGHEEYLPIYTGALAFVGVLVVASFLLLDRITEEQKSIRALLHAASHQYDDARVAREAVTRLAVRTPASADEQTLAMLERLRNRLQTNEQRFVDARNNAKTPDSTRDLLASVRFDGPDSTAGRIRSHVEALTAFLTAATAGAAEWPPTSLRVLTGEPAADLIRQLRQTDDRLVEELGAQQTRMQFMLKVFHGSILAGLIAVGAFVFYPLFRRLNDQRRSLVNQATTDPLTGILNRRSFESAGRNEFARARRYGGDLSVMILDLDHFKKLNDTFGHATGDDVLRTMTSICTEKLRQTDIFARIGGEEFAAILPETNKTEAVAVAEKLREMLSNTSLTAKETTMPVRFSVSIGVAAVKDLESDTDLDVLLHRADLRLYEAKRLGRNRVVSWDPDETDENGRLMPGVKTPDSRLDLN